MAQPSSPPLALTPQFCFSTVALQDFLRMSRASVDDSINQNINALLQPGKEGFDPSSTTTRYPCSSQLRQIPSSSCQNFKSKVLFPSWAARERVLDYCAKVASSVDSDDPESVLRQIESAKAQAQIVDERLDPYSARFFPREARTEQLAAILRQEIGVEKIVRARTWQVVTERCGDDWRNWEQALSEWEGRRIPTRHDGQTIKYS